MRPYSSVTRRLVACDLCSFPISGSHAVCLYSATLQILFIMALVPGNIRPAFFRGLSQKHDRYPDRWCSGRLSFNAYGVRRGVFPRYSMNVCPANKALVFRKVADVSAYDLHLGRIHCPGNASMHIRSRDMLRKHGENEPVKFWSR